MPTATDIQQLLGFIDPFCALQGIDEHGFGTIPITSSAYNEEEGAFEPLGEFTVILVLRWASNPVHAQMVGRFTPATGETAGIPIEGLYKLVRTGQGFGRLERISLERLYARDVFRHAC